MSNGNDRLYQIPSWGEQFSFDRVANDTLEGRILNFEVTAPHDHGVGLHVDLTTHQFDGGVKKYVGLSPDPIINAPSNSFGW